MANWNWTVSTITTFTTTKGKTWPCLSLSFGEIGITGGFKTYHQERRASREPHIHKNAHREMIWSTCLIDWVGLTSKKSQTSIPLSHSAIISKWTFFWKRVFSRSLFTEECAKWPAKTRHAWNTSSSSTDSPFQQILTKICSFPWTRRAHTQPMLLCWLLF